MKVLVATEKPFAAVAVDGIRKVLDEAGYELALLEKYTEKEELIAAVADVDGMIVRSDKVTAEVIEAAPLTGNLKVKIDENIRTHHRDNVKIISLPKGKGKKDGSYDSILQPSGFHGRPICEDDTGEDPRKECNCLHLCVVSHLDNLHIV